MKVSMDDLLKSKPSKEIIFNSISLSLRYWEKMNKEAVELKKRQEEERRKLQPTYDLYHASFTI